MRPAVWRSATPAIATTIASTHMRIRRQSPKVATSDTAPIVQKLTRCPTAPKTMPSRRAPTVTTAGRESAPDITKLWHATVLTPLPRRFRLNPSRIQSRTLRRNRGNDEESQVTARYGGPKFRGPCNRSSSSPPPTTPLEGRPRRGPSDFWRTTLDSRLRGNDEQ